MMANALPRLHRFSPQFRSVIHVPVLHYLESEKYDSELLLRNFVFTLFSAYFQQDISLSLPNPPIPTASQFADPFKFLSTLVLKVIFFL